ncbi:MAG TPA: WYL domain-containing protein [Marmoricola sp.]|nr:WYL domain-containing protein [Marmoricola sp.]
MTKTSGRDQREPMERLVRLATVLHHAGRDGVPAQKLIKVAGFEGGEDPGSQLTREFRHMRNLGWQIENLGERGAPAVYRMTSVDNRLKVRLTGPQQAALRRAVLLADRADLVERLGLPESSRPAEVVSAVPAAAHSEALSTVLRAVRTSSRLHFRYHGTERDVHPESVHADNTVWYLRGLEDGGDRVKRFVVSRMLDVRADSPGTASRPEVSRHVGLHPMSWEIDPPVEVTLQAPADYAADVRRWLGDPLSEEVDGDRTTLVYRVTNRSALRSRIYQLGTRVRVVGPSDVRAELIAELAEMAGE